MFAHDLCHSQIGKRSQVQGSTFRVKDKGKIKEPKFSRQMLVLPHNCQGSARFQIGEDKANSSLLIEKTKRHTVHSPRKRLAQRERLSCASDFHKYSIFNIQ
jgi:hypothetical protein